MTKQDAPARIEAKSDRPAHASRQFFPFEKKIAARWIAFRKMEIFPPTKQRSALLEFARAIGSRSRALRRDECGDWRINGKRGHI
jgi:hypothetical protein